MRFDIFDRTMIEQYNATEKHLVISIRSPKSENAKVSEKCKDTRIDTLFLEIQGDATGKGYVNFSNAIARKILSVVNRYKNQTDLIVINCETGESISSAIGASLNKIINGEEPKEFFRYFSPNLFVFNKMIDNKGGK